MKDGQSVQIMKEPWDFLVILDACRYDYFGRVWRRFFSEGQLHRAQSIGTATVEWRNLSFPDVYSDVVYVSANPFINSRQAILGFGGAEHFHRVIDVWASDWDQQAGTVWPDRVTQAAIRARNEYRDKRFIIHYIQPHAPYLNLSGNIQGFPIPNLEKQTILTGLSEGAAESAFKWKWFSRLMPLFRILFSGTSEWYLRQWLQMSPCSPMDAARRAVGRKGLRLAYRTNLEMVLAEVVRLVNVLSGTIVISSDHGERLGECFAYSHIAGSASRHLREIPWLIINRPKARVEEDKHSVETDKSLEQGPMNSLEQSQIEERLRALGYME